MFTKIKTTIECIPGGMMLIPLLLGVALNTLAPDTGAYFGSLTEGMIGGTILTLAVWFFCIGVSIDLQATGMVLRGPSTLVITKIAIAWVVAMIAASFIPDTDTQTGSFTGLSVLTAVSAADIINGGLYTGLINQCDTKEESGAFAPMSLKSGPLIIMVIFGFAGLTFFESYHFIDTASPFLIGFTLGNLDYDPCSFLSKATPVLISFFGLVLGNTINLSVIVDIGLPGILLGIAVTVVIGIPLIVADCVIGDGNGTASVAASLTAGVTIVNPMIITQINPVFEPVTTSITALVAAGVTVTAILMPIITALYTKRSNKNLVVNETVTTPAGSLHH